MDSDESILKAARTKIFCGQDAQLYLHVGYFMSWFSAVELHLTLILAIALGFRQIDKFELLVQGMDARVKCERLRRACKKHTQMGPNLETRLSHFEKKIVDVRNKLAHRHAAMPAP